MIHVELVCSLLIKMVSSSIYQSRYILACYFTRPRDDMTTHSGLVTILQTAT